MATVPIPGCGFSSGAWQLQLGRDHLCPPRSQPKNFFNQTQHTVDSLSFLTSWLEVDKTQVYGLRNWPRLLRALNADLGSDALGK